MEAGKNTMRGASTSPDAATGPAPANRASSVTPAKRSLPDTPLKENEMFCEKCKQVRLKSDFFRRSAMGRTEYFKQCDPCRDKKRKATAALKARREKEEQEKNESEAKDENEAKKRQTPKKAVGKSLQKVKTEGDEVQKRQQEQNPGGKTHQGQQKQEQQEQGQPKHGNQYPEHDYHGRQNYGQQHLGQPHLGQQQGQRQSDHQHYEQQDHAQQQYGQRHLAQPDLGQQIQEQQHLGPQQHGQQPFEQYVQVALRRAGPQPQQQGLQPLHQHSLAQDVDMNEGPNTAYSTRRSAPPAEPYSFPSTDVLEPMPGHPSHVLSTPATRPVAQTQRPINLDFMELEEDMAYYKDEPAESYGSPSTFFDTESEVPDGITASHSDPVGTDDPPHGPVDNLVVSDAGSPGFIVSRAGPSDANPHPAPGPLGDMSISAIPSLNADQIPGGVKLTSEHFELTHTVALKTPLPDDVVQTRIDFERRRFEDGIKTCHYLRCQSDESLRRIWRKREAAIVLDLIVVPLPEPQPIFGLNYGEGSHRNLGKAGFHAAPAPDPLV